MCGSTRTITCGPRPASAAPARTGSTTWSSRPRTWSSPIPSRRATSNLPGSPAARSSASDRAAALPTAVTSWRHRMFADYSWSELGAIFAMQGFAGLILFSVFVLMALGLAIIFGQMGVINMAHGEFMILGAYVTYLMSNLFSAYIPALFSMYFFVAMAVAFVAAGALGMLVEWALIRHLYKRPLDTLLATWGLSLILQQTYRTVFGAREVGVSIPDWMMGSLPITDLIEVPINGIFVMVRAISISVGVYVMMYRSGWGKQVRAINNN